MTQKILVYIGTYSPADRDGIYAYWFDLTSGKLTPAGGIGGIVNPSYLAFSADERFLYAVSERGDYEGQDSGAINAFTIHPESGALTPLNQKPSLGSGPCHISLDHTGRWVLAANYNAGNIVVYECLADGSLGETAAFKQHVGGSVNPQRQEGPHAHCIGVDPTNELVLAVDLGLDKVLLYRLDSASGKLMSSRPAWLETRAGAGPRHFAFHPGGQHLFLINELDSNIVTYAFDVARGVIRETGVVSTLPDAFTGESTCAAIKVAPSGRFVYGSNRGHDSVAVFEFDAASEALIPRGHVQTGGKTPRDFAITPDGNYLLAANQESDNLVVFRINADSGQPEATGEVISVSKPVCVRIAGGS